MGMPSGARTPLSPTSAGDSTAGFAFHSLCLQIKDPARSISFYRDVLGMRIVKASESHGFSMIFLGFPEVPLPSSRRSSLGKQRGEVTLDEAAQDEVQFASARGLLQLVHVHGTDEDDSFRIKSSSSPGFCHLTLSVPDLDGALARMTRFGVTILERGSAGGAGRGEYAAISDPDGYSIQLLSQDRTREEDLRRKLEELVRIGQSSSAHQGVVSPPAIASPTALASPLRKASPPPPLPASTKKGSKGDGSR